MNDLFYPAYREGELDPQARQFLAAIAAADLPQGAGIGTDPSRIAVGGDSAGATLAAALTLLSRDRRGPGIGFQLLICPATSLYPDR